MIDVVSGRVQGDRSAVATTADMSECGCRSGAAGELYGQRRQATNSHKAQRAELIASTQREPMGLRTGCHT